MAEQNGFPGAVTDPVGRSALLKAAWRLLPLIGLGYGIAYMDRVNISFASLQMNQDLHFSSAVYGLGGGLFFLSYAVLEVPSNLMLMRFGARRWLARIMLTWGLLAAGMMFVRSPNQFYVMRFLLGAAEAGFFPGVVYYLMQWFPASERGRAISRFYVALPLSSVVMGALAGTLLGFSRYCQTVLPTPGGCRRRSEPGSQRRLRRTGPNSARREIQALAAHCWIRASGCWAWPTSAFSAPCTLSPFRRPKS
jgi:MFS family permease